MTNITLLLIIALYCALILGIDPYFGRNELNQTDFLLGRNKIPGSPSPFDVSIKSA
ncbi:hypothetical protein GCM10010965_08920 [Caldalkalibacillus thermarum]|uniref:hypothetical protein n=1 Tax=Caldalkalibacillus thermarum TaxID=296745 RepID=UPI001669EADE|nr:hypothetical protein [Caldalkalibacillus thermarum]GGK18074.1 hypothetical protein GCM10010965_08920 [Caldalkalibacillus thermarum]